MARRVRAFISEARRVSEGGERKREREREREREVCDTLTEVSRVRIIRSFLDRTHVAACDAYVCGLER